MTDLNLGAGVTLGDASGNIGEVAREHLGRIARMKRDPAVESGLPPALGQYTVPHMATYQSMIGTFSRTYLPSDEALKNSWENSQIMRNDVGIMECLLSRQRSVALLPWHIEPENEHSQDQKDLAKHLTSMIDRIRDFTDYKRCLQEAIWYGRSAVQNRYGRVRVGDRYHLLPKSRTKNDPGWKPINGDKLVYRFDEGSNMNADQMGIRIGHNDVSVARQRGWNVEPTWYGFAYFLPDHIRETMVVHKHLIEDGDYRDVTAAGTLHGKGIRSMIYWEWYQKQELLGFMMEYLERAAGGIEIVEYPMGDPEALKEVKKAMAERLSGQRNTLFFPKRMGSEQLYNVIPIEPGFQGVQMVQELLTKYFNHRIKRLFLGQTLSSESDGAGLGSSGISDLHRDTLFQILEFDARKLGETLTWDLLKPIIEMNFPQAAGIHFKLKIDLEEEDSERILNSLTMAYQMGADVPEKDVFDAIGINAAEPGEKVLSLHQQQQAMAQMGQMFPGADVPGDGDGDGIPNEDGFDKPPGQQFDRGQDFPGQQPDQFAGNDGARVRVYRQKGEPVRYMASNVADVAASQTAMPTKAQEKAGNYRKGRFWWNGYEISIETPKGRRRGHYATPMAAHYGYLRRTNGADGDQVDVFIGPNINSQLVVVIDQANRSGHFDEHKVMIGFDDEIEARAAYQRSYSPGWQVGPMRAMTVAKFCQWLKSGNQNVPIERYARKPAAGQKGLGFDEAEHPREPAGNEKGGRFTKRLNFTPEEATEAWINHQTDPLFVRRRGTVVARVRRLTKRINGWKSTEELTVKDRYGKRDIRRTYDDMKDLQELGYVQMVWDNTGLPFYAWSNQDLPDLAHS